MSDEGIIVECPVDGCDYSGLPESVAGHFSGKRDDAHKGTYADVLADLEEQQRQKRQESGDGSGKVGGSNPPSEPEEITPEEAAETATTDGGASTTETVEFPENPEADVDDGPEVEEPTCPDCGSNYYALTEDHADELRSNGDEWALDYQYICAECTEVYNDE